MYIQSYAGTVDLRIPAHEAYESCFVIVDRLAQGEMMTKIAKEYNVGNSTLTEEQIENSRISDHNGESVCLPKRTKDNASC